MHINRLKFENLMLQISSTSFSRTWNDIIIIHFGHSVVKKNNYCRILIFLMINTQITSQLIVPLQHRHVDTQELFSTPTRTRERISDFFSRRINQTNDLKLFRRIFLSIFWKIDEKSRRGASRRSVVARVVWTKWRQRVQRRGGHDRATAQRARRR